MTNNEKKRKLNNYKSRQSTLLYEVLIKTETKAANESFTFEYKIFVKV